MREVPTQLMVLDDFLGGTTTQRILEYAVAHEAGFRASKVALGQAAFVDESRRVSRVNLDLDPLMPLIEPAIRTAVDDAIPALGLVNIEAYHLEPELTWCGDGGFFRRHTDTLARDRPANQRVITMVYYFHKSPRPFQGGRLRLYGLGAETDHCLAEVEPRRDRAVFFPSWLPHEVLPVRCGSDAFPDGRFTISCWVRKTSEQGARP